MEELIKRTIDVLDLRIVKFQRKIEKIKIAKEALRCICKHKFDNNICIYCKLEEVVN